MRPSRRRSIEAMAQLAYALLPNDAPPVMLSGIRQLVWHASGIPARRLAAAHRHVSRWRSIRRSWPERRQRARSDADRRRRLCATAQSSAALEPGRGVARRAGCCGISHEPLRMARTEGNCVGALLCPARSPADAAGRQLAHRHARRPGDGPRGGIARSRASVALGHGAGDHRRTAGPSLPADRSRSRPSRRSARSRAVGSRSRPTTSRPSPCAGASGSRAASSRRRTSRRGSTSPFSQRPVCCSGRTVPRRCPGRAWCASTS